MLTSFHRAIASCCERSEDYIHNHPLSAPMVSGVKRAIPCSSGEWGRNE